MYRIYLKSFYCVALLCLITTLHGQEPLSIKGLDLEGNINDWYDAQLSSPDLFQVVGAYYTISKPYSGTHPFFSSFYSVQSKISYRGRIFNNSQLIYDLQQDAVYMIHPVSEMHFKLQQEYIEWFEMDGHHFRPVADAGFFEVLFDGNALKLFKKHSKRDVVKDEDDIHYIAIEEYFVYKNGKLNRVTNKRSFINLFPEKKEAINKLAKEIKSALRNDLDYAFVQLTALCERETEL